MPHTRDLYFWVWPAALCALLALRVLRAKLKRAPAASPHRVPADPPNDLVTFKAAIAELQLGPRVVPLSTEGWLHPLTKLDVLSALRDTGIPEAELADYLPRQRDQELLERYWRHLGLVPVPIPRLARLPITDNARLNVIVALRSYGTPAAVLDAYRAGQNDQALLDLYWSKIDSIRV